MGLRMQNQVMVILIFLLLLMTIYNMVRPVFYLVVRISDCFKCLVTEVGNLKERNFLRIDPEHEHIFDQFRLDEEK